ncbi:hypothetical protein HA49_14975 [Tatumella morbirosei]|uniref:Uncharacterized protein n=1 Tax=Tatumella morbirosei TaxID=642227 RepID=A0A095UCE8_9GAMM|nr:hypothetical protein HA49_14975 [Tatumella morbirosei]
MKIPPDTSHQIGAYLWLAGIDILIEVFINEDVCCDFLYIKICIYIRIFIRNGNYFRMIVKSR